MPQLSLKLWFQKPNLNLKPPKILVSTKLLNITPYWNY